MLPSSKTSLINGGFSPKAAAWVLIVCFIAGAAGIQIVSRILHRYIPSHVVDCHHTHDEEATEPPKHDYIGHAHGNPRHELKGHRHDSRSRHHSINGHLQRHHRRPSSGSAHQQQHPDGHLQSQRPPLHSHFSSKVSQLVSSQKAFCDENGQCYGYTDPCGVDCFRNLQARGGSKLQLHATARPASLQRSSSTPQRPMHQTERTPLLAQVDEEDGSALAHQPFTPAELSHTTTTGSPTSPHPHSPHHSHSHSQSSSDDDAEPPEHHHHVPTNAFLSIGLQTCLAIALHKLPEGFITYATNHANPKLGFSVFVALFIHNITEGFAMALPLYLALQSRGKAIAWASILGGMSQPLGAGVAALWFHLAGNSESWGEPGEGVYGCLFACTAGILASVALQLFSESMDLTHNRNLCMAFAFVGMGILGISGALTA